MYEVEIDLFDRWPGLGVLVIAKQIEVAPINLMGQMDGEVIEIILNRVEPFGAVAFALVKPGDVVQIDRVFLIEPA